MGLGLGQLPYRGVKAHTVILCGNVLPYFKLSGYSFALKCETICHLASSTALSVLCQEGTESFHSRMTGVCIGEFPFQERPIGHWEEHPILRLLYVSKALFHPVLGWVVFSWCSDTRMQWTEGFGFPFLVVSIVLIFAILQIVRVLPWDR